MLDQSKKFYMNIDMYIKDLFQTHTSMSILKLYMYRAAEEILKFFWSEFLKYLFSTQKFCNNPIKAWFVSFKNMPRDFSNNGHIWNKHPPSWKRLIFIVPNATKRTSNFYMISHF